MRLLQHARRFGPLCLLVLASCGAPVELDADSGSLTAGRCANLYGARLQSQLPAAMERIGRLTTPYAQKLHAELTSGRLVPLPFCEMTRFEVTELVKYVPLDAQFPGGVSAQHRLLRNADARLMGVVERALYGFQWEDRMYLRTGMSLDDLVITLAHEGEPVFRQAHLGDYTDPRVTCAEELAAYEAEILLVRDRVSGNERAKIHRELRELFDLSALKANSCELR
jgi:hypothetical protein